MGQERNDETTGAARSRAPRGREPAREEAPQGEGGSYVIGEDGVRRLVERGEDKGLRSVAEANPHLAPEAPDAK